MSPADFTQLIAEEGAKLGELHARLRQAFAQQDRDAQSHSAWDQAAYAFRSYVSRMEPYIESARRKTRYSGRLLEFVVCFLEVDPWFCESGYLKQTFLTRLKQSDLDEAVLARHLLS